MKIKALVVAAVMATTLALVGCGGTGGQASESSEADWSDFPQETLKLYDSAPADYHDLPTVTPDELKSAIDSGEQMVIVDTNTKSMYDDGHVPGAISIPWNMSGFKQDPNLPRGVKLYFYCVCADEEDSGHMGLSAVKDWGYRNVVLLKGGTPAWEAAGYELVKD